MFVCFVWHSLGRVWGSMRHYVCSISTGGVQTSSPFLFDLHTFVYFVQDVNTSILDHHSQLQLSFRQYTYIHGSLRLPEWTSSPRKRW